MMNKWTLAVALPALVGALYSCGSSTNAYTGGSGGGRCAKNADCATGICTHGACENGNRDAGNGPSTSGGSGSNNLPGGSSCVANAECASGLCLGGACASGQPGGGACKADADCASGVCQGGACAGNGQGAPSGGACTSNADCASNSCVNGACSAGSGLPDGASCSTGAECASGACPKGICGVVVMQQPTGSPCKAGTDCASGLCVSGVCTNPTTPSVGGGTVTTGPQFNGSGSGFRPLVAGCGPDTANQCTGTCEQAGGDPKAKIIRPPATLCFASPDDLTPQDPAAVIEQSIESLNGVTYVHVRITFDPSFDDNVYGTDSNRTDSGWHRRGGPHPYGHAFDPDIVKSDHTEILMTDATGATVISFHEDYISADPSQPCGYGTLGVTGGDGQVTTGDPTKILAVSTSLSRDLNGCGYCKSSACAPSGDCTIDSPTTDKDYTANSATPNWDYRVVYEMWIDESAFGSAGFGQAYMTYVHASPNKSTLVSLNITPTPCPPSWDKPYCPLSVIEEGRNCFGSGGGGGAGGGGGSGGGGTTGSGGTAGGGGTGGGTPMPCPVNYQIYITSEGKQTCTPIPFANYPNKSACPMGYMLDIPTEGQYCVPTTP